MSSICVRTPLRFLLSALCFLPVGAVEAQRGVEGGVHSLATFSEHSLGGAGLHFSLRPGGRARFSLGATGGVQDEHAALRAEATGQFLLNPGSRSRGFYAGGGLAGVVGRVENAYLLLILGMESRPGGGSGWVVETGVGGGFRVLVGYRWRKLKP